jgi:uncharacterized protein
MIRATIHRDYWYTRLEINAQRAIFHQWDQLEASGCIENFRITAGKADGFREGWFFADSDAYKWLEAASRIWASHPDPQLARLMDTLIELLRSAQMPDGYLFTYNQIHFPGVRWHNLQIEHELYCHGHLIEAGVSHFLATGRTDLLAIAQKAADRIVADFRGKSAEYTPGHEEIEIALMRLHQVIQDDSAYLDMARQFIEQRGRTPHFALSLLQQNMRVGQRRKLVQEKRREYLAGHPGFKPFQLPPGNHSPKKFNAPLRWYASALSGKYFQQHVPVRRQTIPVGHSVRFGYLETAVSMLSRENGDLTLIPALEQTWERMVTRRMYVTGGIGSVPGLEGFGNDDELDPEYAYAETCAALACLFWNWEMEQLTGEAKYSELFEWQLYNAAAVGMGLDGTTYLYNNPLTCHGEVTRQPWYAVPCCPSNLSRTWADLGRYIFSCAPGKLRIHQYISSELSNRIIPDDEGGNTTVNVSLESGLPWEGCTQIKITPNPDQAFPFELQLRQPVWASGMHVMLNGEPIVTASGNVDPKISTSSGYDPRPAVFVPISHAWSSGDEVKIDFDMPIQLRSAHPRVRGHHGKVAVTRGPLVYCLENLDNPDVDIFTTRLNPATLEPVFDNSMLGGMIKLRGKTKEGNSLTFIPYFLWGNRGPSQMTVWVNA